MKNKSKNCLFRANKNTHWTQIKKENQNIHRANTDYLVVFWQTRVPPLIKLVRRDEATDVVAPVVVVVDFFPSVVTCAAADPLASTVESKNWPILSSCQNQYNRSSLLICYVFMHVKGKNERNRLHTHTYPSHQHKKGTSWCTRERK